jgi:hypothetical protein
VRISPTSGRIASDLGVHGEGANPAATARHAPIEAADRLAEMPRHHAELDVEIEIGMFGLDPRIGRAPIAALIEVASVIDVAAHHHPKRAIGAAVGPQPRL